MTRPFFGFDHVDTRVKSLKAVEAFYDRLMPELGLPRKLHSHVDELGEWRPPSDDRPYNTVEYFEEASGGDVCRFIGFIEDANMLPTLTRIAFRTQAPLDVDYWRSFLDSIGAVNIEPSASDDYPAIFFEDPSGTRLEICARKRGVEEPQ